MMGYLFLGLAVFAGCAKGYASKKISGKIVTAYSVSKVTFIRCLLCVLISLVPFLFSKGNAYVNYGLLWIPALSGAATAVFLVMWMNAVREGAYVTVSAFCNAGFILPLIGGILFWGEKLTVKSAAAVCMMSAAIVLLCRYNRSIKEKISRKTAVSLVLVLIMQGSSQFLQKLYMVKQGDAAVYSLVCFIASAAVLGSVLPFIKPKDEPSEQISGAVYGYMVLMAAALFLSTYCQTLAADRMDAMLLYPLLNVLSISCSGIMSALCFGEKFRWESVCGMGMAMVAVTIYMG